MGFEQAAEQKQADATDHHDEHGADGEAAAGRGADAARELHHHGGGEHNQADDLQEFAEGAHDDFILVVVRRATNWRLAAPWATTRVAGCDFSYC